MDVFYFFYFLLAIFLSFYIPGSLFLSKIKLSFFTRTILSFLVGMVFFGWQEYLFGYLNLRLLSPLYLGACLLLWLFQKKKGKAMFVLPKIYVSRSSFFMTVILFLGVFQQVLNIFFTGIPYHGGYFFCCGNIGDNMYSAALTNQLTYHYPPFEPGMSGIIVRNYHYWGSSVIAGLIRIFHLPLFSTEFRFMALFISIFLGLSALAFSNVLKLPKLYKIWLLFFLYFGSDLIYLFVSLARHRLSFQMSSLEDGGTFLLNVPRAFAVILFFAGLSLFVDWLKKRDLPTTLLLAFVLAPLVGFKIYVGLFILFGLGLLACIKAINKNFEFARLFLATFLLSLMVYLPVNSGAGGFYFTGFYIFENFIQQGWFMMGKLELIRQVYLIHHSLLRIGEYEIFYIIFFITAVFGFKLLGLFQTKKSLSLFPKELHIFFAGGFLGSALLGFFFQQSTGGQNSFNFLVNIFIFGSVYAALSCWYWTPKINKAIGWIAIAIIVFFSSLRIGNEAITNISNINHHKGLFVSAAKLQALSYLKKRTKGSDVVLSLDSWEKNESLALQILSNSQQFLLGNAALTDHGVSTQKRIEVIGKLLETEDDKEFIHILKTNNIRYIYALRDENIPALIKPITQVPIVFSNNQAIIYHVD